MTSDNLNVISGHMNCIPPTKTAQSSTSIAQRTSFDKFLEENKHATRKELLKLWMKMLFVRTSDAQMEKIRKFYIEELSKTLVIPEYAGLFPVSGPYELLVVFTFPWLKSTPKSVTNDMLFVYKTTSPDTDNMYKAFKDSFQRVGLISDDACIVRDKVEKRHGVNVGISWRLSQLPAGKRKPELFPE
jgi:Holliday junction resolvase RusA-like endonuclease